LSANRVVSAERIADGLCGGAPPPSAVTQVHRQISELRKFIGAQTIETRSPGYVLHVEREALDADRFQLSVNDASEALRRGETQFAARLFRQALGLWRG
jgi:DNA-binding SARP family transcriptional activator